MGEKIVEFDKWCSKCEHENKNENESPCDICLSEPVNTDSRKPVCFKERS